MRLRLCGTARNKILRDLIAMGAVAAALTIAPQARAIPISTTSFYLTQPETGGTPISNADAVEITIDLNTTTTATVTFTPPTAGPNTGTMKGPYELNVRGTYSATLCPGSCVTNGGEDSFGVMALTTGSQTETSPFTIDLTATGSNSWATAAAVLIPTCPGSEANNPPACADGISGDGYATSKYSHGFEAEVSYGTQDAGYNVPVPEPSSLAMLGAALALPGLLYRRRRST